MIFLLVRQINSRHAFLARFTGTKERENQSHTNANDVNLWITLTTILCCVLEIILYFVYNRLVRIRLFLSELNVLFRSILGCQSSREVKQRQILRLRRIRR